MSVPVVLGREATHGTVAASFSAAPVNFDAMLKKANVIPEEQRGTQDVHFTTIPGQTHEEWSVKDSYVYHDSFGFFLDSILGLPTSVLSETGVYDSTYKFVDDPSSLSFKWTQSRRTVQAYQILFAVADKLTLSFEAGGLLKWSASGVAMSETEVAAPTFTYTTTRPMPAWMGTVTLLGGAYTRLVKGSVTLTRNRKPFRTINNTADPLDFSIGNRTVEFDLTCDFNAKTVYDDFKSATPTDALTIAWEDTGVLIGATNYAKLTVKLGTIGWESGEIDTGGDFPALNLTGKATYNSGDASTTVWTLRSTKQYQTAVS